jgi:hypothetical protein
LEVDECVVVTFSIDAEVYQGYWNGNVDCPPENEEFVEEEVADFFTVIF